MTSISIGTQEAWRPFLSRPPAVKRARRGERVARAAVPWPVLVLIASFLAPTELSLYIAGLRLPPHRIALILFLPVALWRLATVREIRVRAFDVLMPIYAAWTLVVYILHGGCADGLQYGGSIALESFGAFLIARAYVTSLALFQATVRALVLAVGAVFLVALPETISGVHYVHDALREVTGYVHPVGHEVRLGLTRAYGTFDHPIHLGTFCAGILAMVWYADLSRRAWLARLGLVSGATVLGLSSAPILCLGLQGVFIGWDRVTRGLPFRLMLTLGGIAVVYVLLSLVMTRTPVSFVATGFTLDSSTGYYRLLIWQHGFENVLANPWIGIGLADWERPEWMASATVDAYWLVTTMRSGIPAFLMLATVVILVVRAAIRRRRVSRSHAERQAALGWLIAFTALSLVACTVHYWNVLHSYFFFILGLAGWLANPVPKGQAMRPDPHDRRRQPTRSPARRVPDEAWAR